MTQPPDDRAAGSAGIRPERLRCEHLADPLGIGEPRPRLSWEPVGEGRAQRQSAYRVLVAGSRAALEAGLEPGRGDVWDSGRVASDATFGVVYNGPRLASGQRCWWTVRLWDEGGRASDWAAPAYWEMGLLEPGDWSGSWIAVDDEAIPGVQEPTDETELVYDAIRGMEPCPFLRREFDLGAPVRSARAYVTARGIYELRINGERVGEDVLRPGWTDYGERIQVQTYDVTAHLREGANCLGAILADGWYAGYVGFVPKHQGFLYGRRTSLLLELRVELEDGTTRTVASDGRWTTSFGPLRYADLLMGQAIDHRSDLGGWDEPGYDDAAWYRAALQPPPAAALVASAAPPARVVTELEPVAVTRQSEDVQVVDFGQNAVGWVRLEAEGEAGTTIRLRHAEATNPDGSVYTDNLRSAAQTDLFVLGGEGRETFEPRFTFHGCRYVEVRGYPGDLGADAIRFRVVSTDAPAAGEFACSSDLVNRLQRNIVWGQRGNYLEVPTDCPQRDERLGWTADAQVFLRTGTFNADVAAFFDKWTRDLLDAQSPNGAFPDVAPRVSVVRDGAPAWADAGVIVPWTLWRVYGDARLVERCWEPMERWMRYLREANPDLLRRRRRNNDYGDWLHVGDPTPKDLLATAYWAYDAALMAEMAAATDRPERAAAYRQLFEAIRERFVETWVGPDGRVEGDSQTGYLLALGMDLLPEELRRAAAEHLVRTLEARDVHLATGFVGVGLLCPVLDEIGRPDLAYRLLLNEDYPSWGYSIRHGATTIWERWDGWTEERGFQTPKMNSLNHYSLGSVGEWLYRGVAGIDQQPGAVAYDRLRIRPRVSEALDWVRASYRSIRGTVATEWRWEDDALHLRVEVPANTTAVIHLPTPDPDAVAESGAPLADAAGIERVSTGARTTDVATGSGVYAFRIPAGAVRFEGADAPRSGVPVS